LEAFDGVRVRSGALEAFAAALLRDAGASETGAAGTARALVDASSRGFDTHGIRLVPFYRDQLIGGRIDGKASPTVTRPMPAVAIVDAHDGLGHPASYRAIEEGIAIADTVGIAAVAVTRSSHHGATGCYTIAAARAGYAALGCTNADPAVAPHGGIKAFFGTNPISFAAPLPGEAPLVLDMATSSIPMNRVLLRRDTGTKLPPDVAVDAAGEPTIDPHAATTLVPLGGAAWGYKGAGLSVMVELLCGPMTGMVHGFRRKSLGGPDFTTPVPIGHFFLVLKPGAFRSREAWLAMAGDLVADLRAQPARHGEAGPQAPSDPEKREAADRAVRGVPVDRATWGRLVASAEAGGIALPPVEAAG
jgi:LDH2 family malate/lactate/ureidoglycolate dehydrogenase